MEMRKGVIGLRCLEAGAAADIMKHSKYRNECED